MGKRLLIAGFSVGALLGVLGLVGVIVAPSFINNFVTSVSFIVLSDRK